MLRAVRL